MTSSHHLKATLRSLKWLVKRRNTDLKSPPANSPLLLGIVLDGSQVGAVAPRRTAPPCAPVRPLLRSMWALRALSDRVKLFLPSGGQGPSVSTSASNRAHRNPPHPISPHSSTWNSAPSPSLHSGPVPNKPFFFLCLLPHSQYPQHNH